MSTYFFLHFVIFYLKRDYTGKYYAVRVLRQAGF